MTKAKDRPQKGARKLIIDKEEWFFLIVGGKVLIWPPSIPSIVSYEKLTFNRHQVSFDDAITPWDMRLFIDKEIRRLPEEKINAYIKAREDSIKKEKLEDIDNLRKSVYERARELVDMNNDVNNVVGSHYIFCSDEQRKIAEEHALKNQQKNFGFLEDLMWLIANGDITVDGKKQKPLSKKDSWDD